MANRMFHDPQTLGNRTIIQAGSFAPNGSSAVSAASVKGLGFTVARTGVGAFTITLTDPYVGILAAIATVQLNAATDVVLEVGAIDVVTAKTIAIRAVKGSDASATDIAANANNRINFVLYLQNSTIA